MAVPWGPSPEFEGPAGYTYAAVLVRAPAADRGAAFLDTLRRIRFNGWIAPVEDGWAPVIPAPARRGTVAAGRRGLVGMGEALAASAEAVLAFRVLGDRQLVLVVWASGGEVARYVSDPSREPGADRDVLSDPVGAEDAEAIAAVCGRPEVAEELMDLLAEPLDPDEEIESERLTRVLRLLGLPSWLVNAWRLPRDLPTGPQSKDLVRLGAGRTGPPGWVAGRAANVRRRWHTPPPTLANPPRGDDGMDDLAMWL